MDGSAELRTRIGSQVDTIRTKMPGVHAAIKRKAEAVGNSAYRLVRQGCGGKPGCFYAMEGGRVVGAPFDQAVMADVAALMVEFGATYILIWPVDGEGQHGTD